MITTARSVDQAAVRPSTLFRFAPAAVVISYLLIGIAAYWPAYAGISQRPFVGAYDFQQSVWFIAWIPHALAHGLNPFFSSALLAPSGVNLAQNTASPFLGLLTIPMSPFLDPMARANLLVVLAMPLSATSAFVVLRKWRVHVPAAALGGLIFGFAAYMVDQNVELIFLPLVPLIAFVVVSIVRGGGTPLRLGIELGLLVTAQYLISPEILTIVILFGLVGTAFIAVRAPTTIVKKAWQPIAVAVALSGTLLAYPIWMMTAGPQHFIGRTWQTNNPYHNDVLSFIIPGSEQKVSLGLRSVGDHLGGFSGIGTGGYIGALLLVIAAYLAWHSRKQLRTQLALVLLLSAMILSLGPYVSFDGRQTSFPLPFLLLDHIPLLFDILPDRVSLVTNACVAAVIAFGMDDLSRIRASREHSASYGRLRIREVALFAGTLIGILVATPLPQEVTLNSTSGDIPVALPAAVRQIVPSDDPIALTYPYPSLFSMGPMLWQSNDEFQFRLLGGYAYHPNSEDGPSFNPSVLQPHVLQAFLAGQDPFTAFGLSPIYGKPLPLSDALVTTTRTTLRDYDVRLVIVNAETYGSAPVLKLFNEALGPPSVVKGPFSVWVGKRAAL